MVRPGGIFLGIEFMDNKSNYEIPIHVIEQADRCNKDKACMTDPDYPLCEVKHSYADTRFTVIACNSYHHECNYRIFSNQTSLCICPARAFIFDKYKK